MNIEEKKADFMRRFKASMERKAEYIAQMEKRMRDDYRRRTGKEAESFWVWIYSKRVNRAAEDRNFSLSSVPYPAMI